MLLCWHFLKTKICRVESPRRSCSKQFAVRLVAVELTFGCCRSLQLADQALGLVDYSECSLDFLAIVVPDCKEIFTVLFFRFPCCWQVASRIGVGIGVVLCQFVFQPSLFQLFQNKRRRSDSSGHLLVVTFSDFGIPGKGGREVPPFITAGDQASSYPVLCTRILARATVEIRLLHSPLR